MPTDRAKSPAELETITRLRADEGALDRALAEARAEAEAAVAVARATAARLREEARTSLAAELERLDAEARAESERAQEAARARVDEVVLRGLRARAIERRARVVSLIVDLVTGRGPP